MIPDIPPVSVDVFIDFESGIRYSKIISKIYEEGS